MKKLIVCVPLFLLLSGCELWEALLDGLARIKGQPQFAFVIPVLPDGGAPGDTTPEIAVAAVSAPGQAFVFQRTRPFPDRYSEARRVVWDGTGTRFAAQVREEFFGGFDDWIFVYDRDLVQEFSGSDDTVGTSMQSGCQPLDAPSLQPAADLLVSEGSLAPGSIARFRPGSGVIQGAGFVGWLAPDAFLMTLYHEPKAFAVAPDGTEHSLALITGSPTLGEFVTLGAVFTKSGGSWSASDCMLTLPPVPVRPAPDPLITIDSSGTLLADGIALVDQNGAAIDGVALADGSY
ncbi:MAG: hypothetical protein WBB85_20640 [Albidovulum sp.]|uniref:hypothetical protein n=1 Tax=Albidovulum sp. TaxID=1872424 RepID=UPI003CADE3E0